MSENPELGGNSNDEHKLHHPDGSIASDDQGDLKTAINSLAKGRKVWMCDMSLLTTFASDGNTNQTIGRPTGVSKDRINAGLTKYVSGC